MPRGYVSVKGYTRKTKHGSVRVKGHSRKVKGAILQRTPKKKSSESLDYFQLPPTEPSKRLDRLRELAKLAERLPPPVREKKLARLEKIKERYVNFNTPKHHRISKDKMYL